MTVIINITSKDGTLLDRIPVDKPDFTVWGSLGQHVVDRIEAEVKRELGLSS